MVSPLLIMGGIGSGKSMLASYLAQFGGDIVDADQLGHEVLLDPAIVRQIQTRWPDAVAAGVVDRKRLGEAVFADGIALLELESIIHPRVRERLSEFVARSARPVVEASVPHAVTYQGTRVVVDARTELRIERLIERGLSKKQIEARIRQQQSRRSLLSDADVVVSNGADPSALKVAAKALWNWWVQGGTT